MDSQRPEFFTVLGLTLFSPLYDSRNHGFSISSKILGFGCCMVFPHHGMLILVSLTLGIVAMLPVGFYIFVRTKGHKWINILGCSEHIESSLANPSYVTWVVKQIFFNLSSCDYFLVSNGRGEFGKITDG